MPYRRRYYRRRRLSPQEKADQARCELYRQVRTETSAGSRALKLKLADHLIYGTISALSAAVVVAFLFWFVFSPGPYRDYRQSTQTMGGVVLLVALVASIGLPGAVMSQLVRPKNLESRRVCSSRLRFLLRPTGACESSLRDSVLRVRLDRSFGLF